MKKLFASLSLLSSAEAFLSGVTVGCGETVAFWYLSKTTENPYLLSLFLSAPLALAALLQIVFRTHLKNSTWLTRPSLHMLIACIGLALMTLLHNSALLFVGLCLVGISQIMTSGSLQQLFARKISTQGQGSFFSRRFVITNIATLVCFLSASVYLDKLDTRTAALIFFWIAFAAKFISFAITLLLEKIPDSPFVETTAPQSVIGIFGRREFFTLCALAFLFRASVNISSTFYSAWLLHEIHVSAISYSALIAVPILVRCWSGYNWGILVDQNKTFDALTSSLFLIAATPIFCAFARDLPFIGLLQATSGLGWAGYEFLIVMIVQRMFPHAILMSLCSFSAVGHLGGVAGGLIGGAIFQATKSYDMLFVLSTILRLSTAGLMLGYFMKKGFFRAATLRVSVGVLQSLSPAPAARGFAKVVHIANRGKKIVNARREERKRANS